MAKPITVPFVFQNQAGPIPLSQLDTDISTVYGAINDFATYGNYVVDSSGAANVIVVTTAAGIAFAYSAGIPLQVQIANTTTNAAVSINVNGLGAKAILNADGSAPVAGQFISGEVLPLIYDGVAFRNINSEGSSAPTFFGNGTAAAPSIAFANSPGTGFFRGGADILGVATAGVQRATVSATGNWVIPAATGGTYTFSINSNGGLAAALQGAAGISALQEFSGNGGTPGTLSLTLGQIASGQSIVLARGAQSLQIGANAGGQLTISSTGTVSVGAPASGTALAVTSVAAGSALTMADGTVAAAATFSSGRLNFGTTNSTNVNITTNGSTAAVFNTTQDLTVIGRLAVNNGTITTALAGFGTPSGAITSGITGGSTLPQVAATLGGFLAYMKTIGFIST